MLLLNQFLENFCGTILNNWDHGSIFLGSLLVISQVLLLSSKFGGRNINKSLVLHTHWNPVIL